jgi:hypothetical protein
MCPVPGNRRKTPLITEFSPAGQPQHTGLSV